MCVCVCVAFGTDSVIAVHLIDVAVIATVIVMMTFDCDIAGDADLRLRCGRGILPCVRHCSGHDACVLPCGESGRLVYHVAVGSRVCLSRSVSAYRVR
jgi:hypothetical protein